MRTFMSVLQPNTKFYLSKWWGSIRGVLIYRRSRRSRVCNHYTRKDCPIGSTEKYLQYYKSPYTLSTICITNNILYTASVVISLNKTAFCFQTWLLSMCCIRTASYQRRYKNGTSSALCLALTIQKGKYWLFLKN